jgi:hypothetical protein
MVACVGVKMTRIAISNILMAAFLIAISLWTARAAEIQNSNNKFCAFSLEGPIISGDADKLSASISRGHVDPYNERTVSICLKSNGGSFEEGLKIADLIYDGGLSTVVEYGSECYSACAIIFMAGVGSEREAPMRKLSVGGVLGFHAPYLALPDEKYSKQDVEVAAQGMRAAILSLVRLSSKRTQLHSGDFIKKSLISKILENGPTEVFFVKTAYDAARWDILLYDAAQYWPKPSSIDSVKNVCINFHSANMDENTAVKTALTLKVEKYSSKFQKDDFRVLVKRAETSDNICEIYPRTSKFSDKVEFFACSYDYWSSKNFGDCREYLTAPAFRVGKYVPDFFSYEPDTPLLQFRK